MADLVASETACERAVQGSTHENQARAWDRWETWCDSVGLEDNFLLCYFSKGQRIRLVGAFAMAVRQGQCSGQSYDFLAGSTVRSIISYLVEAFRDNDYPNPIKDEDGELGRIISRIYRAWKNEDPPVKQQKALPICVLREISKMNLTEKQRAITQLVIWAFFFACRSCEYLKVPQAEKTQNGCLAPLEHPVFQRRKRVEPQQPRTRICRLCLDNFRMAKERREDEQSHTSPFGRQTPVSGETMGCPSKTNLGVLRSNSRYKSIGGLEKLPD